MTFPAGSPDFEEHERRLGKHGRLGVSARLIDSGDGIRARIDYRADQQFPMASIVKVPVGMALEMMCHRSELSLRDRLTIASGSSCPGPPRNPLDRIYFLPWRSRRTKSLGDLLKLMIVHSDNTAADAILERIGGPHTVRAFLSTVGIEGIHVKRAISELLAYYYNLALLPQAECSRGRMASIIHTLRQLRSAYRCRIAKERGLVETSEDTCTPTTMTRLLLLAFSDPRFKRTQQAMAGCRTGSMRISEGLRTCGIPISSLSHKTGSLGGVTNDIGMVRCHERSRLVLSILTYGASVSTQTRDQVMADTTVSVIKAIAPDN